MNLASEILTYGRNIEKLESVDIGIPFLLSHGTNDNMTRFLSPS